MFTKLVHKNALWSIQDRCDVVKSSFTKLWVKSPFTQILSHFIVMQSHLLHENALAWQQPGRVYNDGGATINIPLNTEKVYIY